MADKLIFHMDVNSAFLSWEAVYRLQNNPDDIDLRTIPSAVGGDQETRHGIILAKSSPAKKYHVTTGEPIVAAKKKCPSLLVVPPSMGIYKEYSKAFRQLLSEYVPAMEPFSIDEVFCDMTGTSKLYGTPVETAHMLKDKIRDTLGFTVNVGISTNKLLAKMAGDFEKPDKVHTLFPDEIPTKMWPLPVSDLLFVGKSTADRLCKLGIYTIGDLAQINRDMLIGQFGAAQGEMLYQYSHGIASDELNLAEREYKGYGNSKTLAKDVTTKEEAFPILLALCESVCRRLRADEKHASKVSVFYTTASFTKSSHQKGLSSSTNVTDEIYQCACQLFLEMWDGKTPLRLLGVQASQVGEEDSYQYNLFQDFSSTFSAPTERHEKLQKLDAALDTIRGKYGKDAVIRSSLLPPSSH